MGNRAIINAYDEAGTEFIFTSEGFYDEFLKLGGAREQVGYWTEFIHERSNWFLMDEAGYIPVRGVGFQKDACADIVTILTEDAPVSISLSYDAKILTREGFKCVNNLAHGDLVCWGMGDNSGFKKIYDISRDSGIYDLMHIKTELERSVISGYTIIGDFVK